MYRRTVIPYVVMVKAVGKHTENKLKLKTFLKVAMLIFIPVMHMSRLQDALLVAATCYRL